MLQRRIRYQQELRQLNDVLDDMPEYPIYSTTKGQYAINIYGRTQHFMDLAAAQIGQLQARAGWLRTHPSAEE